MRKYYIDNIRNLCILLLFPYHTAMIFNNYGDSWYVHSKGTEAAGLFLISLYPWWMAILFALAGMSTVYALNKRTAKEFLVERVHKLLIPCISGIILLCRCRPISRAVVFTAMVEPILNTFECFFK